MVEADGVFASKVEAGVLVEHEGLIAVLEDGQVLELNQPDWNLVLVYEEACEKHERDDQHGGQGYGQLLVGEAGSENKSIPTVGVVHEEQDND